MKWFFYLVGIATLLISLGSCAAAKTSIHEGVAAIVGVIGMLALGVGALLDKLDVVDKTIRDQAYEVGKVFSEYLHGPK